MSERDAEVWELRRLAESGADVAAIFSTRAIQDRLVDRGLARRLELSECTEQLQTTSRWLNRLPIAITAKGLDLLAEIDR